MVIVIESLTTKKTKYFELILYSFSKMVGGVKNIADTLKVR